jgi:hypothetical protein
LSNADGQFNWCAYGSDFPPNAVENGSGGYTLKGSPPFILTTSNGPATVTTNTYSGGTITAITDATGCPGVLCGKDGESAGLLNCCATGTTNCDGTCKINCVVGCARCLPQTTSTLPYAAVWSDGVYCIVTNKRLVAGHNTGLTYITYNWQGAWVKIQSGDNVGYNISAPQHCN